MLKLNFPMCIREIFQLYPYHGYAFEEMYNFIQIVYWHERKMWEAKVLQLRNDISNVTFNQIESERP